MADDDAARCQPGLILPVWEPQDGLNWTDRVFRGAVYFFSLFYLFLGVSIISDRFMAAIEVITSQEREVTVKRKGGADQKVVVRVWNETVANLTLMALGSSAPEILLSIIEIGAKNFEAGDLGPGTIVGSAAYNLFVIIALCVSVIPDGETRRIKHLRVFFVTATFSVFAYIWMYVILAVISVGVVEVWEGLLTFAFFPITVLLAYAADRRIKIPYKKFRLNRNRVIVAAESADIEMGSDEATLVEEVIDPKRQEYAAVLRELRNQNPSKSMGELEAMAKEQIEQSAHKSRAFYRIQATRNITGGGSLLTRARESPGPGAGDERGPDAGTSSEGRVYFEPCSYAVLENVGELEVRVVREGGDLEYKVLVDYATEDGTATAGTDYVGASGTVVFAPGDTEQYIRLQVIDDDVFEEEEFFYVHLTKVRVPGLASSVRDAVRLGSPRTAKVLILDDDHCGVFAFPDACVDVPESQGVYELPVERTSGARGEIRLPYWTVDGTAKAGKDYLEARGYVCFDNNESRKTIPIDLIPEHCYEKNVSFYVQLGPPEEAGSTPNEDLLKKSPDELTLDEKVALEGRPKLGTLYKIQVNIRESDEFKNTVDKLIEKSGSSALTVSTTSWKEQFTEAVRVNAGGDDEEGEGDEPSEPSVFDYVMHVLSVFWKVLFASVPPTAICNGWACFWFSIMWIGILTAIIGDVASHFGCSVGMIDSVTAITLVAMGTSLPDTFASKVAAIQDNTADNSVGNVTGSNAVNVFLGIGVAWSIAAIYHSFHGNQFLVSPGNLAFSVTLFCTEAVVAIIILLVRRSKFVGGELGGPRNYKYITSMLFFGLWLIYIVLSTLEAYHVITF
ncbi:sodium/calcium exchanger 1 isoform X2 [Nilaparvata lugens]|uniref:sodium/calcium exchanger 1 isoform X2 n=1 Tax=Nilaparvata lugens TaxID=108931 RepID=UPI00193CCE7F|nr:sodium/calcium exchanger 1 isoform X2 [Nilaparvata lugens]